MRSFQHSPDPYPQNSLMTQPRKLENNEPSKWVLNYVYRISDHYFLLYIIIWAGEKKDLSNSAKSTTKIGRQ